MITSVGQSSCVSRGTAFLGKPLAQIKLGSSGHLANGSIGGKSLAVAAPKRRQERITLIVPRASYSGNYYGPVGGDARIKVIGVGGGGGNAVNRMISSGLQVRKRIETRQLDGVSLCILPPIWNQSKY